MTFNDMVKMVRQGKHIPTSAVIRKDYGGYYLGNLPNDFNIPFNSIVGDSRLTYHLESEGLNEWDIACRKYTCSCCIPVELGEELDDKILNPLMIYINSWVTIDNDGDIELYAKLSCDQRIRIGNDSIQIQDIREYNEDSGIGDGYGIDNTEFINFIFNLMGDWCVDFDLDLQNKINQQLD